ncbi:MAG TPA: YibE/F family protein, partial [Candidatus Peribacteria bacterium]|nr:YibE/F family protein [Candidatus Peribacteria bacterium]
RMLDGADAGTVFSMDNGILANRDDMRLQAGQQVIIDRMTKADGSVQYAMRERYRLPAIYWLLGAFVVLGIIFGGVTGFMSIVGLLVSVGVLLLFVVPKIADGADPLVISVIGSYIIAFTSLYLAHGFKKRTSVALLSTCVTLALAAATAVLSVKFTQLFGMGSEESLYLQSGPLAGVNLRGLLIGGFIIGALGVLDDVTTAQTAAIDEISKANPSLTPAQLYRAGFSVGKEHIASLINTLALAYVGASLPLLLLFRENKDVPTWMIVNSETIAEEIVRTLVGSTTLLLAVPISTWCASYFLKNRTGRVQPADPHAHHHHH